MHFKASQYANDTIKLVEENLQKKLQDVDAIARLNLIVKEVHIRAKQYSDCDYKKTHSLYQKAVKRVALEWSMFSWLYRTILENEYPFKKFFKEDLDAKLRIYLEEDKALVDSIQKDLEKNDAYTLALEEEKQTLIKTLPKSVVIDTLDKAFQHCPAKKRDSLKKFISLKFHPDKDTQGTNPLGDFPLLNSISKNFDNFLMLALEQVSNQRALRDAPWSNIIEYTQFVCEDLELFKSYVAGCMYLTVFPPSRYPFFIAIPVYIAELCIVASSVGTWFAFRAIGRLLGGVLYKMESFVTNGYYVKHESLAIARQLSVDDDLILSMLQNELNENSFDDLKRDFYNGLINYFIMVVQTEQSKAENSEECQNTVELTAQSSESRAFILRSALVFSILECSHATWGESLGAEEYDVTKIDGLKKFIENNWLNVQYNCPQDIIPQEDDDIAKLLERARLCQKMGIPSPINGLYKDATYLVSPLSRFGITHNAYADAIKDELPKGLGAKVGSLLYRTMLILLYVPSMLVDTVMVLFRAVVFSIIAAAVVSTLLIMLAFNSPIYLYDASASICRGIYNIVWSGRRNITQESPVVLDKLSALQANSLLGITEPVRSDKAEIDDISTTSSSNGLPDINDID